MKISLTIVALFILLASCSKIVENNENRQKLWPAELTIHAIDNPNELLIIADSASTQWQLVNVWATWCAPCREEMPLLQELSEQFEDEVLSVRLLSIDVDVNLVKEFLLQTKIYLPSYISTREDVEEKLNVSVYPMTFLVSPKGKVVKSFTGARAWSSKAMVLQIKTLINGSLNE